MRSCRAISVIMSCDGHTFRSMKKVSVWLVLGGIHLYTREIYSLQKIQEKMSKIRKSRRRWHTLQTTCKTCKNSDVNTFQRLSRLRYDMGRRSRPEPDTRLLVSISDRCSSSFFSGAHSEQISYKICSTSLSTYNCFCFFS